MKKESILKILTFFAVTGPFIAFFLKVYELPVYGVFFVLSGYLFYKNYQLLPLEKQKPFIISKIFSVLLIVVLIAVYVYI